MKNGGVWRRLAGSLLGTRQIYLCGAVRDGKCVNCHINRKGEDNVRRIHICNDAASYARLHQTRAGFPRPSMTNPCLHDMVKIGYASDVEARRKQLSTTALPFEYEIYATYETSGQLEDKKLHELIDTLNPKLRLAKNREFFAMSAEKAYRLLEAIAIISGSADKLKRVAQRQGETTAGSSKRQTHGSGSSGRKQRPAINFQKCGIPVGAELVFIDGRGKPRPTLTTLRFRLVTRINMGVWNPAHVWYARA